MALSEIAVLPKAGSEPSKFSSSETPGLAAVALRAAESLRCEAVPVDAPSNDYDSFAGAYAVENENNLVNAYYERPAMLALAGEVTGRHILDAGCGAGPLTAALLERGAVVTGIDSSVAMLTLARQRLGAC